VKLSTLAPMLKGQLIGPDRCYTSISTDSRSLRPGALFIAISGDTFDGHAFIEQAKQQGAVAALVEKAMATDIAQVCVADTRKALGQLAQAWREQFSIPVIALTGSCGKTTTKEMLRAILSECGSVLASSKSFNNDIGVPLTLLDLSAQHQFAVIEMGANHPGEIAYLSKLSKPNIALITNIAPAHLQGFGSVENVARAKSEIFLGLAAAGIAVINSDDHFGKLWQDRLANHAVIRFGMSQSADFLARHVQFDSQGKAQFVLVTPQGEIAIDLALPGQHNVLNALAAAAVVQQLGVPLQQIKTGLENMSGVSGRTMLLKSSSGAAIIDDTYNANPRSVTAALQLLIHYPGRRIFVMGDMAELGDNAAYYHRQMGQLAKELGIEQVYTCGELSVLTAQAFGATGKHFSTQEALVHALKPLLQTGVTVLVKGSRKAQMEKVVSLLMHS
jgi:UDP-N-acetylmuramoyl-tripeptide--D-alanyl-D-alanine ligase